MDRQTKKIVVIVVIALIGSVGWKVWGSKAKVPVAVVQPVVEAPQTITLAEEPVKSQTFADVEAVREQDMEDKRNADELAKQKLKKGKSVECLFWKQQKQTSSAANVDEKIEKFCNL